MKNKEETISKLQLFCLILQTQIGVGVLGLPYAMNEAVGTDGWISVIIAGCIVQVLIIIYWKIGKTYPHETIFRIQEIVFGLWVGRLFNLMFIVYGIVVSTLILVLYQDILKLWVLPDTPRWIVILLMLGSCLYLAKERLRIIARFYVFVMVFIPTIFILSLIAFPSVAEYRYLLPIGQSGFVKILLGSHAALISMLGFEMLLIFYPFVKGNNREILKFASLANGTTTFIYVFLLVICFMVFSPKELTMVPQPVLYMLKAISFKVVERIDLLFISIWLVVVSSSLISYLLMYSKGIAHVMKKRSHSKPLYWCAVIPFIGALIPTTEANIAKFSTWVEYFSYIIIIVLPLLVLMALMIQKRLKRRRRVS